MKLFSAFTVLSLSSSLALAAPLSIVGQVDITIPVKDKNGQRVEQHFVLPKYLYSKEMSSAMKKQARAFKPYSLSNMRAAVELPPKVDLGMEGTPVLNQGRHGSCVTFATSGAIDAAMAAGDYVSQLCSLELGTSLAINDEIPYSGWNGTFVDSVIDQMLTYGVVGKNHQLLNGCAGVKQYPISDEYNEGMPMSKEDYQKVSVPLKDVISSHSFGLYESESDYGRDIVWETKEALAKGQRLVIGMGLAVQFNNGGAVGSSVTENDTWMMTPDILMEVAKGNIYAGHALVVIGYDDNAQAIDPSGYTNTGLFKVRNSWSEYAGDKGDYYISYDHFQILVDSINSVSVKK